MTAVTNQTEHNLGTALSTLGAARGVRPSCSLMAAGAFALGLTALGCALPAQGAHDAHATAGFALCVLV